MAITELGHLVPNTETQGDLSLHPVKGIAPPESGLHCRRRSRSGLNRAKQAIPSLTASPPIT